MRRIDLIAGTPYAFQQSRYGTPEQVWVIDIRPAHATYDGPAFCSGGDGVAVMRQVTDYVRDDAGRAVRDENGNVARQTTWQPLVVRTRHIVRTWEEQELANARARAAREQREREAREARERRDREREAAEQRRNVALQQLRDAGIAVDAIQHVSYDGTFRVPQSVLEAIGATLAGTIRL
jgi:hypothetical protein